MGTLLRFVGGLVLGAAVGASLVLLTAPRSGVDMRRELQERVQGVLDEGRQAAEARRQELSERFASLKQ